MAAALLPILEIHGQWGPDFRARGEGEISGHDADDGVQVIRERDGAAQDGAAAAKAALPQAVAEDGHMLVTELALLRGEVAAEEGPAAK